MYVTMMMTDQIPLDLPALLNGELPMMPHMVNGDGSQQVIFVQVNPGETFTIRAEDGSLQCIQARAKCCCIRKCTTEAILKPMTLQHTQRLRCWLRGSTIVRPPQRISMTTVWIELSRVHLWGLQVGTFHPQCFVD
ncbi:UNVERIFIED_CONTAM: hypothetical protein FKN15_026966 [Acipenser sinensis]